MHRLWWRSTEIYSPEEKKIERKGLVEQFYFKMIFLFTLFSYHIIHIISMLSFSRFLIISMKIVLILVLLAIVNSIDAPIYNYSYHIAYDETFVIDSVNYKVNGQKFYDPVNNRERVDRTNGRYNLFCGTVLPNVTTPCQQITADNKRWVIFPNKTSCCLCCDAAHGCGILKPSWLAGAQYLGQ